MSVSAARPVSAMVPSARVAAAGSASAAYRPPSAWAIITVSEWATMSCISRAIRARSAAVAIWDCWSRSTSRRSARSTSASIVSRRDRRTRPNAQTASAATPVKIAVDAAPGASNQPFIATPSSDRADERADDRDAVRPARPVHGDGVQGDAGRRRRPGRRAGRRTQLEQRDRVDRDRRGRRTHAAPGERERRARREISGVGERAAERRRPRRVAMSVDVVTTSRSRNRGAGRVDDEPVRLLPAQQALPSRHPTRVGAGDSVGVPPQDDRAARRVRPEEQMVHGNMCARPYGGQDRPMT